MAYKGPYVDTLSSLPTVVDCQKACQVRALVL